MRWWRPALVLMLVASVDACAKTHARTPPERPPLEVPLAPPRVVAPTPPADEPVPESEPVREPTTTVARPARRPPSRPARPETSPTEAAKPDVPSTNRVVQPPRLQTPQTADEGESARRIRDTIQRATGTLDQITYSALNPDARAQYDTARRFIQQAQEALQAGNYVFATYLAGKAETLADELSDR